MSGTSSSGAVNTTEIGCSFTIVTMPLVSAACTMLPGSTSRNPALPVSGDRDCRIADLGLRVVDHRLIALDLRHQLLNGACWVSNCWREAKS